jgi:hypothetical protein
MPRLRVTRNSATGAAVAAVAAGSSYDADATTYFAAVEAADGQSLESGVKTAINDFIVGCKADGTWSALKASCIFAGARTLAGALVPLVGTAPTNYNFVSGDYSRTTGLAGNGSTKYLSSNRSGSADPQNSFHMCCYRTTGTNNLQVVMGDHGDERANLGPNMMLFYNGSFYSRARNSIANSLGTAAGLQLVGVSRASGGSYSHRRSGQTTAVTQASATPDPTVLFLYAGNTSPTPNTFSDQRLSFYSIGESVDLTLLDTRLTTLMSSLATAIP